MRGNKLALLLLLSLIVVPVGFAAAANTQGLSWGAIVGDEFQYTYAMESSFEFLSPYSEVIVVTITDLPDIPDTATKGWLYSMWTDYTVEYINGTNVRYFPLQWFFILPVGNWTLFSMMFQESFDYTEVPGNSDVYGGVVIDQISIWGFAYSETHEFFNYTFNNEFTLHYSKSDGVLNYWRLRLGGPNSDGYTLYTMTRDSYFGGVLGFDPMIAIIGAIGVVALITIIVVKIKR